MPSTREQFEARIQASPYDVAAKLVFADWLEEQGDKRADEIRQLCQFRMPFSRRELKWLFAIEKNLSLNEGSAVECADVRSASQHLGAEATASLQADLQSVAKDRVARHFPRDDRGLFAFRTTVVLAHYEPHERHDYFLAVSGPTRRRDPAILTVQVEDGRLPNFEHNWSDRRELWSDCEPTAENVPPDVSAMARFGDDAQFASLKSRNLESDEPARIALALHYLDRGMFEDALETCGVTWSEDVSRTLNGECFELPHVCDCQYDKEKIAAKRASLLRRTLWESAPWNFRSALQRQTDRLNARRKKKAPADLYLYIVPGQIHSRKARLTVTGAGDSQGPHLTFQGSGSNVRPWRWTWTRPLEVDLQRFSSD